MGYKHIWRRIINNYIEKIEEYLGDLSEGTPPDPPSLEICQAINRVIDSLHLSMRGIPVITPPGEYFNMDGSNWLNCRCRDAVGDGSRKCPECGRYV